MFVDYYEIFINMLNILFLDVEFIIFYISA